ncbi:hypothetical protein CBR_g49421 [Chara braunii]|uniref:Reverse transcriptase domain-containing protein n=1 Tax=Chara braunii TaxID=69332 RepID=A0A388M500_CHABU|nr:hypothetical protein CBR_g49421 [Chara braunii]|eukprot:GBG89631.1 hypothetical protein CBR_g49421 [Chara braunii]
MEVRGVIAVKIGGMTLHAVVHRFASDVEWPVTIEPTAGSTGLIRWLGGKWKQMGILAQLSLIGGQESHRHRGIGHNTPQWLNLPLKFDSRRDRAQHPPVAEPAAEVRLEELGKTVASVQEFVEIEKARRMEREQRRREREEASLAEEAARAAEEAARAAEAEHAFRKVEKQRKREEEQLVMAKAVEVQLSVRLSKKFGSNSGGRRGRRERARRAESGVIERDNNRSINPIRVRVSSDDEWSVSVFQILRKQDEIGCRSLSLYIEGGNTWCDKWKGLRKAFGSSCVTYEGKTGCLRVFRKAFEVEGSIAFQYLRRWRARRSVNKPVLISILRNPKRLDTIRRWDLDSLSSLFNSVKDFERKSTRAYLRRLIGRCVKEGFGFNFSARLVFRLLFDDRIKLVEVRKLVNDKLGELTLPPCVTRRARRSLRIIWTRNPSVADLIHNDRAFTRMNVSPCACAGLPYPRVRGHVRVRLREVEGISPLMMNANNVPKINHRDRGRKLGQEVSEGFSNWANVKGNSVLCSPAELTRCMTQDGTQQNNFLDMCEIVEVRRKFSGMVLTPLDRNPGETLVLCPFLYYEGMMTLFVRNAGYVPVMKSESLVVDEMRSKLREEGILDFARWDEKGSIVHAFAMPKHKDLERFRPICPSYSEPTTRTSKVVAKALNYLLDCLPQEWHFNLKAVSMLKKRLDGINMKLSRSGVDPNVVAQSFDIKDMFSLLPHHGIIEAVDWLLEFHVTKGRAFVRVNVRGKGANFGVTTGYDHWRKITFEDIRKFVRFELAHTYTYALGVLLQQKIGIPMGKSTSPPLACIMCARSEHLFLHSLGKQRSAVFGVRLIDDVSLFVAAEKLRTSDVADVFSGFSNCYPDNLTLKRTDDGTGTWEFLRCEALLLCVDLILALRRGLLRS